MSKFVHEADNAIAIPQVFSEKSKAKNAGNLHFLLFSKLFYPIKGKFCYLSHI